MLAIVKEVGIFVVIAQAILYFVPSENYVKYVKVLIGVMMVAKLITPIFSLLSGEVFSELTYEGEVFLESMEKAEISAVGETMEGKIYEQIQSEMKEKLEKDPVEGFVIKDVYIEETKEGIGQVTILVQNVGNEKNVAKEELLKRHYQELLQTDAINLQVK